MKVRVLIVDDEAPARNRLKELLGDSAAQMPVELAGEAATGRAALDFLNHHAVDVVLLDIRMPEMDGIELAAHLQKLEFPPAVIFTTAYDEYAMKAFDVHAVDYLLKPIRAARLLEALQRAKNLAPLRPEVLDRLPRQPRRHLGVSERGKVVLVPVENILYLRAELKYVTIRTPQREYLLEEPLTRLEQEYPERFVRIHRNCLVARDAIQGFERCEGEGGESGWQVLLKGLNEKLPVSRRQQHLVKGLGR